MVEQFAARLAAIVERFTIGRVERAVKDHARTLRGRGGRRGPRAGRAPVLCYYPGCRNLAAPRFGMFCAAEHKGISKADKEKYRAQRLGSEQKKAAGAAPKRGSRKK